MKITSRRCDTCKNDFGPDLSRKGSLKAKNCYQCQNEKKKNASGKGEAKCGCTAGECRVIAEGSAAPAAIVALCHRITPSKLQAAASALRQQAETEAKTRATNAEYVLRSETDARWNAAEGLIRSVHMAQKDALPEEWWEIIGPIWEDFQSRWNAL